MEELLENVERSASEHLSQETIMTDGGFEYGGIGGTSCDNCGDYVSDRYHRVFSDDEGRLLACPGCTSGEVTGETILRRK